MTTILNEIHAPLTKLTANSLRESIVSNEIGADERLV